MKVNAYRFPNNLLQLRKLKCLGELSHWIMKVSHRGVHETKSVA